MTNPTITITLPLETVKRIKLSLVRAVNAANNDISSFDTERFAQRKATAVTALQDFMDVVFEEALKPGTGLTFADVSLSNEYMAEN